ncbi:hypothetical protein CMO86_01175, partial [Candidatus Woesearchaeota archaeon]|nr:hypothetical protein [Candidatus Woesearchaeota archaeon]
MDKNSIMYSEEYLNNNYGTRANVGEVVMYEGNPIPSGMPGIMAMLEKERALNITGHIEVHLEHIKKMELEDIVCLRDMCEHELANRLGDKGKLIVNG